MATVWLDGGWVGGWVEWLAAVETSMCLTYHFDPPFEESACGIACRGDLRQSGEGAERLPVRLGRRGFGRLPALRVGAEAAEKASHQAWTCS